MKKIILSLFAMLLILFGCGETKHEVNTPAPSTSAPTGAVQGFVRDYKTNAAIEDVTVILYAAGARTATTDENGYWYFDNVRAETTGTPLVYSLTAPDADEDGSADYLPMMGQTNIVETITAGNTDYGQTNALTLVNDWMVQTASVSGFVTDSTSGQGINGATVVILDFIAGGGPVWAPGNSNASVDSATLTATTAARTEGGDGYYSFTTVPAVNGLVAANFGAYATGYEYAIPGLAIDNSFLNLQFGSSAMVDFQLDPLDNAMGLVVASVSVATDSSVNMLIMQDATGTGATGAVPKVDMNGATQLVFTLIFDQAVNTSQFYGDTIQLTDQNGVVAPSLTAVWSTGNYAVTLTGAIDIFDDTLANPYTLATNRIIYAAGGGQAAASGQIAATTNLARFIAYNSTYVATNPTPALFLEDTDTSIVGNVNVSLYSADSQVNPTTAQNYTGMWEENVLNPYGFTAQALATAVDIYWTDAAPIYDVSDISYYVRERDPASNEVLNNWAEAAAGVTFQSDDRFIAQNLNITGQFAFTGGIAGQLRFGNVLDIAVVLDDTLGVENAIDTAKLLSLADVQAPEITGFFDFTAAAATNTPDYEDGMIIFSETMSPTATTSVTTNNTALFSMTPAWVVDATDAATRLLLNAVGAASATVSTTAVDSIVAGTGVITFDTAGDADQFFVGQIVTVTYLNGDTETTNVTAIDTDGAAPTITINVGGLALTGSDFTQAATLSVSGTTGLRSGQAAVAFAGASTTDTDITFAGVTNVAVGDTLILRKSTDVNSDVSVTVVDYDSAAGTATIASTDTTGYDRVIFPGDVLTVIATDEAGNAMHTDANEITDDTANTWPAGGPIAIK